MIVKFDNGQVAEVDGCVNDDETEVNIYSSKGNWDVYELIEFDPFDRIAVVGSYRRTDWRM